MTKGDKMAALGLVKVHRTGGVRYRDLIDGEEVKIVRGDTMELYEPMHGIVFMYTVVKVDDRGRRGTVYTIKYNSDNGGLFRFPSHLLKDARMVIRMNR